MARVKPLEFKPTRTRDGQSQTLRCLWRVAELPGAGDLLLARVPSTGGWVIEQARWVASDAVQLHGIRFNGDAPATAGLTWAWEPTRRPRPAEPPRLVRDATALLVTNLAVCPWTPGQRGQDGGDRRQADTSPP